MAMRMTPMPSLAAPSAGTLRAAPTVQSRALSRCLELPVLGGNRVEILEHGRPAAGSVFDALDTATDHINIDSFLKILIRGIILLLALIINVYVQNLRENERAGAA